VTNDDLITLNEAVGAQRDALTERLMAFAVAPADAPSDDETADIALEALFLRMFTIYEERLERLFLHYVTGGQSISGIGAHTFLSITDERLAKRLVRAGYNFLSWSKPAEVRTMASNYLDRGWPFVDMLGISTETLSDCTKIRNRIAHRSDEAQSHFSAVQRNLFQTERLFEMSPGQLLRCRFRRSKKLIFQHYNETLAQTLQAIADPPA
jgi:hypothetical protein